MSEQDWVGTGDPIEVTPGRQIAADKEFENRYQYAIKSKTHLWIITLVHYVADATLDALAGVNDDTPMLDSETLAMRPHIGCYICEEQFTPRLRYRKCRGEPRG